MVRIIKNHLVRNLIETNMKNGKIVDHKLKKKPKIPWVDNPYDCPASSCDVESKHKHNIVKHLNMCVELEKKRNTVANNKACPVCIFHKDLEDDIVINNQAEKRPYLRRSLLLILYLVKSLQVSLPKYLFPMIRIRKRMYCPQMRKWKIYRVEIRRKNWAKNRLLQKSSSS